jgi:hypothetical protein
VFEYLRSHLGTDIASAHIVIQGSSVLLCDGEQLIDIVRQGQGVLNLLSIESVKKEIDQQLVALRPDPVTAVARLASGT